MTIEIKVPQLPESVSDATLVAWHRKAGDTVARDENLVDLETDKVVLEVPAPAGGVLQEILIKDGATVVAGDVLAILVEGDSKASVAAAKSSAPAVEVTADTSSNDDSGPIKTSPAVRRLLEEHDIIVWQHPFYWYSSPSLLKEWIDVVLQHGFAYGREGKALEGKKLMTAITSGGRRDVYKEGGMRKYSIRQLLAPFEQTVTLCNIEYLPPFVVHGTHLLDIKGIIEAGQDYRRVIIALRDGKLTAEELSTFEYTNDVFV